MRAIDIAIEIAKIKKKIFKNYKEYAKRIKEAFKKVLNDENLRVIVFGSVVRGNYNILSDLDILVISEKANKVKYGETIEKVEKVLNEKLIGIEIHLVTNEIFEKWYKRFLDVYEEV